MAVSQLAARTQKATLTGNEAVATALKQINPDVIAAYPITPQTDIVQYFSNFVADGQVVTEFVTVESEHSAMSATIGASAAGARAMTATSSQGLALMHEMLYIAASFRLPIVISVVNRALSGPINIHCDHSDSMGSRDSGCIQIYSENAQEAYDNTLQAVRIAEHPDVLLPVMVCQDGFTISHCLENLELVDDERVREFVGRYVPEHYLLDLEHPITMGGLALQNYHFESKRQQVDAMEKAKRVIEEIGEEYGRLTGRRYGLLESYKMEDAELALVVLSSTAGTAKDVVDELRREGLKVGLVKPRVFRPFPHERIREALSGVKAVAVMDRSESYSTQGGPLFTEVRSALYEAQSRPLLVNYVFGLGGRETGLKEIRSVYHDLERIAAQGQIERTVTYLGVRE